MLMRTIVTLAAILALGSSPGWANAHKAPRHPTGHHRHGYMVRYQEQPVVPAPYGGGRLVLHPASNIACMTRDRRRARCPAISRSGSMAAPARSTSVSGAIGLATDVRSFRFEIS